MKKGREARNLRTLPRSPSVVKTLSGSIQAAVCGALGCRETAEFVVRHPDYGRRALCFSHAQDLLHKPPQGAEERSEAPADAERPEAGACPPTRKPARTPPTDGEGAIEKAGRSAGWLE